MEAFERSRGERQVRRRPYSLERHALRLELLHPGRRAVLALVHLVLLVAHEAAELVVADGLGVVVVVAVLVREADDRRAARREAVVELADGVAEVARVARAVAEAEERDLLPAEVRVRQLAVEPVVDVRACVSVASTARCRWLPTGAHVVGARVPGRRAADDAVRRLQVRGADVGDGRRADARRVADVARDALRVACGRACPRRQMKNSFRTSAKRGMEQCCPAPAM